MKKNIFILIIIALTSIFLSCQNRFQISDGVFQQAWEEYQLELFKKGWEEEFNWQKRLKLLQDTGKKYRIPANRMIRYVREKYNGFYEKKLKEPKSQMLDKKTNH